MKGAGCAAVEGADTFCLFGERSDDEVAVWDPMVDEANAGLSLQATKEAGCELFMDREAVQGQQESHAVLLKLVPVGDAIEDSGPVACSEGPGSSNSLDQLT